jgi:hypothetical protein
MPYDSNLKNADLDDVLLWEIITTDTDALKTVMEAMLARHADDGRT